MKCESPWRPNFIMPCRVVPWYRRKKNNNKINSQPVILSGEKRLRFAESKFHRVRNEVKPRSGSDAGMWLGIWVAFYSKCNFTLASHQKFKPYPTSPNGSCFCLFASLNPQKFDFGRRSDTPPFAQNDIQRFYSRYALEKTDEE